MRTLTDATRAASERDSTSPLYIVQIDWGDGGVTRVSTFGTFAWNGSTWFGAGLKVDGFDDQGIPSRYTIADPDGAFRTLFLANGIRDRASSCWAAFRDALAGSDPMPVFVGYCDGGAYQNGTLSITLARSKSVRGTTPRQRIGPGIGVNYTGTPGEVVKWGTDRFTLEV